MSVYKIPVALMILLASVFMSSYPAPSEAGFLDTVDHRYSLAIDLLQDESIIRGYGDRRFLPENTLNRAEFLKMIVVSKYAENYYIGKGEQRCFEDVFEDQWFSDYVCFAKEQGIVSGYNNETFRPSQEVNFVEGVKILMQSYKYEIDPYDMGGQWYEKYIAAANADKILPQEVEYYDQTITRGIFAEMLARVLAHKTGKMIGSQTYGQYVLSKAIPVIQERGIENTLPMEFSYNGNDATMLLDTRYYDMEIVLGNNIYRVKEGEECKKTTHCPMESQAESFSSFQKRLDADVIINGGYFEAYSQSLDGNNWHTVWADIVQNWELVSVYGWESAFGNGGMIAQDQDGWYSYYSPVREWVESENIWNALSNYPALLIEGEVNTDIFTIHTSNDKKFSVVSARHGIGLNQDASRIIYKSVVGDAQDLAQALLESGAYNAFQLDSGWSRSLSVEGSTIYTPGRNLTNVITFTRK